jgi:hypothetical protein
MSYGWTSEPEQALAGAGTGAFVFTLSGTSCPSARLAREAIQNSRDAQKKQSSGVEVVFTITSWAGNELKEKLKSLCVENLFHDCKSTKVPGVSLEGLSEKSQILNVTFCEDFGTVGLEGDAVSLEPSPWRTYVYTVGQSFKDTGGGSFGFGKSVFPALSRAATIVIYTVTEEEGPRLIACTYQGAFSKAGMRFTGRAWLGLKDANVGLSPIKPIVGDAAVDLANELGFKRERETGLSVLILDTTVDADELKRGVETHWWPAIEDKILRVAIHNNGRVIHPQPNSRPDLRPYITAYKLACKGLSVEPSGKEMCSVIQKHDLGTVAAVTDILEETDDKEMVKSNQVALIRDSRMVICYYDKYRGPGSQWFGVFVASPSSSETFRMSEPPSHDKWEEDPRVERFEILRDYKGLIRAPLSAWWKKIAPSVPKSLDRIPVVDNILSNFFSTSKGLGSRKLEKEKIPIRYSKQESSLEDVGGKRQIKFRFTIWLPLDAAVETFELELAPTVKMLLDRNLVSDQEDIGFSEIELKGTARRTKNQLDEKKKTLVYGVSFKRGDKLEVIGTSRPFEKEQIYELELNLRSK